MNILQAFTISLLFMTAETTTAITYDLPSSGNVVGGFIRISAKRGENLYDIGQRYDIGVTEIRNANPRISPYRRLSSNETVLIPAQFTLPSGPWQGIVLNLAQMRLYYFNNGKVSTYPVGVGRQGWSTPRGITRIVSKQRNPTWHPPYSIRQEAARKGKYLSMAIPPGPRNPLGHYAMHLGFSGILIHGTTTPRSIGTKSSHGCIRMYNKNIEQLFNAVPIGTSVRIE